jgi:O-antigen/teichoic acid export membrane protein
VAKLNVINILLSFFYRSVFIHYIGVEYLGLTVVYANILMMLSLADMGLSQAIAYKLYKPIHDGDHEEICALMSFYKRLYRKIGFLILVVGAIVSFFIERFIGGYQGLENVGLIFLLMLLLVSISYFVTYKRIFIIADKKEYEITKRLSKFLVFDYSFRMLILFVTQTLIFALIWQLIIKLVECVYINKYIDRAYPFLSGDSNKKLNTTEIYSKMKALLFHKLGDFFVNGTDNIIIAKVSGLVTLGYYANYFLIISVVTSILTMSLNSITANVGNELAKHTTMDLGEQRYLKINMLCNVFFMIVSFGFIINADWFVTIWLGSDYVIEKTTKYLLAINLFLLGTRLISGLYKNAAGVFEPDKYAPILQGLINLTFSVFLGFKFGINGVLIGTAISSILVPMWNRPYILYKYVFKISAKKYWLEFVISMLIYSSLLVAYVALNSNNFAILNSISISIAMIIIVICMSISLPSARLLIKDRMI